MENNFKRRRSYIWNSFTIINDNTASCNYCQQRLSHKSTISNLKHHLKRKHPLALKGTKQPTNDSRDAITEATGESYTLLYVLSDDDTKSSSHVENLEVPTTQVTKQPNQQILIKVPDLQGEPEKEEDNLLKNKRSTTWDCFTPINSWTAVCKICHKVLSYKTSISNLRKHYRKRHGDINDTSNQFSNVESNETQTALNSLSMTDRQSHSSSENPSGPVASIALEKSPTTNVLPTAIPRALCSNVRTKNIDDALIRMVTVDLLPISIVEDSGFQQFSRLLNPSYTLPTKKKLVTELIAAKVEEITQKIHQVLKQVKAVTLTADSWTSYSSQNLTRVKAHFINDDYERESILLSVQSCDVPQTDKDLGDLLEQVTERWNLKEKILLVISDNITEQDEQLQWPHLKCITTIIDFIIQESLKQVEPLLTTVSSVVSLFNRNIEAKEKLSHFQKNNNRELKMLNQCIPGEWNSILYMLKSVEEFTGEICESINSLNGEYAMCNLSEEEFKIVRELIHILEPIESITKVVSKEEITLSLIIVLTNGLLDHYNGLKMEIAFSTEVESVLTEIVENMNARFSNLEATPTLLISTFLDPRFKHVGFSNQTFVDQAKSLVIENLNLLFGDKVEKSTSVALDNEPLFIWHSFDKKVATFDTSASSAKSRAIVELDRYLEEPLLNRNENPLHWWKTNAYNYPLLSNLMRLKFGSIATAACEDNQSVTHRRNSLSHKGIQEIMFVGQNFYVGTKAVGKK